RRFHWNNFECAGLGETLIRLKLRDRWIDDCFESSELGQYAELQGIGILVGLFQLIGCVDFRVNFYRFDGGTLQAQSFAAVALRANSLYLQGAGQGVRIVLQDDDTNYRGSVRVHQYQPAFYYSRWSWKARNFHSHLATSQSSKISANSANEVLVSDRVPHQHSTCLILRSNCSVT